MPDPTGYLWNKAKRRYQTADGAAVPMSTVRESLDNAMNAAAERMGVLSRQLADESITVSEWHAGMQESLKRLHTCAGALARGGWAQVDSTEWGHVGAAIKEQYRYLRGFASDLASGKQELNGRFAARCAMYASSAHGTFEESRRRGEKDAGMTEERRNLHALESCEECLALAAEGWQPIGTLPPVGQQTCLSSCRCSFSYR